MSTPVVPLTLRYCTNVEGWGERVIPEYDITLVTRQKKAKDHW
jgi:hypothetical protein